jgi:hypothetical protein
MSATVETQAQKFRDCADHVLACWDAEVRGARRAWDEATRLYEDHLSRSGRDAGNVVRRAAEAVRTVAEDRARGVGVDKAIRAASGLARFEEYGTARAWDEVKEMAEAIVREIDEAMAGE